MTDILSKFPHQELSPINATNERPDYALLILLCQEISDNAIAIESTCGHGTDGHLDVVTSAARYLAITTTPRALPINPGPDPAPPAHMATHESLHTSDNYAKARPVHARNLLAFRTSTAVESLLKRQLMPSAFIFNTMDIELGYVHYAEKAGRCDISCALCRKGRPFRYFLYET
jgi:hypothetical protein